MDAAGRPYPPPPPHSIPPPPPSTAYPQHQHQHQQQYIHPPTLPPIHTSTPEHHTLPPFRHPSQEYPPPHPPPLSGHATPAPAHRSYSIDSSQPQRTPTTPAHPGPSHPPASAPDAAQPPPPQMDHGQHNGYQLPTHHSLPPPQPPHSAGPPPPHHHDIHHQQQQQQYPPQQPPPPMDGQHYPPQPAPPMYYNGPTQGHMMGYGGPPRKPKTMRATQACEQCRSRKQKCDEGNPCSFCRDTGLQCQYRDTPPAKTDKNMEKIAGYFEALSSKLDVLDTRLSRVEEQQHQVREPVMVSQSQQSRQPPAAYATDTQDEPMSTQADLADHRTAPHKLILLWPSVRPLLQRASVSESDGYAMAIEDRGTLRIYGKGEGIDEFDGTQPGGPESPARSEDSVENSMPTPRNHGLWGFGLSPPTMNSEMRRSEPSTNAGGLKPDGSLDLDGSTVWSLFDSYMRHMHIMHPFLDKSRTKQLVEHFCQFYSPNYRPHLPVFAVGGSTIESNRPLKRQRSNGSSSATVMMGHDAYEPRRKMDRSLGEYRISTERSPGNAIIYLIMALGKMCSHDGPLPGIAKEGGLEVNANIAHQLTGQHGLAGSSPISASMKPSPGSPKATPGSHSTPPADGNKYDMQSRRSSVDRFAPSFAGARNVDVIPGMAYFAKACEILGEQADGNDLVHAQMFLLAGLYKGQLARVKESMSWITMAGRALRQLLDRHKLYNQSYWSLYGDAKQHYTQGQTVIKNKRQNLIVIAAWAAIQLESDILAELRLPESGIRAVENLLCFPHSVPEEEDYSQIQDAGRHDSGKQDDYQHILMYHSSQLWVRKRLNAVHQDIYGAESLNKPLHAVEAMLRSHEEILSAWREKLPPSMQWDDAEDPPPSDILPARLRAKYYGARYVINRPFLDYVLHIMGQVKQGETIDTAAVDGHGNSRNRADIQLFKAINCFTHREIFRAAKRCIDAAIHSTVAFDGVPGRLIVTNIHGTAHAQFGNMLVMSAVYYNPSTRDLVPEAQLRKLLQRTISFLRKHAPISQTCQTDCVILEKINSILFPYPEDMEHIYRNQGIMETTTSSSTTTSFSH